MKDSIVIGKNTLESLTLGMYLDAKIIFREYIQNSVDAIDEAIESGLIFKNGSKIEIFLDKKAKKINFKDNGTGISSKKARNLLLDIGNSNKDFSRNMGFRGIGRLSGLSFCENLVFTTSFKGEKIKTMVEFDGKRLKEFLLPGKYLGLDLVNILEEVTNTYQKAEKEDKHYFCVSLEGVEDIDSILDFDCVCDYISQIAPVPYNIKNFPWGQEINSKVELMGYKIDQYNIFVSDKKRKEKIYKPYKTFFISNFRKKKEDRVKDLIIKPLKNNKGELKGIFWYAETKFFGSICDIKTKGLRLRKRNVLIGDHATLNSIFNEERFNGWFFGEVFVLDNRIIPNARRDNFEKNDEYLNFLGILNNIGRELSLKIRRISSKRQKGWGATEGMLEEMETLMKAGNKKERDEALKIIRETREKAKKELRNQKPDDTIKKLDTLLKKYGQNGKKDFKILDLYDCLTTCQRDTMKRVFKIIEQNFSSSKSKEIIETVVNNFIPEGKL